VIGGWEMPASWLQSVNPIFIILFAPVVGLLWVKLRSHEPSTPAKMGYGLMLLAGGFFVLAWGAAFTTGGAKVSPMWLVVTYFLHTVGELCLSPVGLSSVTKLAPRRLVGQLMGTWFMGTALGNLIAGLAGGGFAGMTTGQLFAAVAKVTGIAGLVLLGLSKPLKSMVGAVGGRSPEVSAEEVGGPPREEVLPT
jgi:POT family proton-dependent oligopeptide transporter